MAHEITLEEAAERARQATLICRLLEDYPHELITYEVSDIANLLCSLTGNVANWLIEESAQRENEETGASEKNG
ncbi:hypothetical protein [Rahnella sp. ChDrAdgB13]|uniref:hypothetical protein n=1 Tax=Rahnella sp. ChDrAdgB13 TaxID=1850581 RepID=UPI001AD85CBB|nr:hypothetical protein [Rahnella sp. ChDrAdgB13]